jgi:hypothetical protein
VDQHDEVDFGAIRYSPFSNLNAVDQVTISIGALVVIAVGQRGYVNPASRDVM